MTRHIPKTATAARTCPLGDDCDLTVAWMAGAKQAKDEAAADYEEAYARGFSAGQEALKGIDKLEIIDSPEIADLRAKLAEAVGALEAAQESIATFMGVHGYPTNSGAADVLRQVNAALALITEGQG
jgi:hypothetical protein